MSREKTKDATKDGAEAAAEGSDEPVAGEGGATSSSAETSIDWRQEAEDTKDRLLRTAAEFQNFRKQSEKRQADTRRFALKDVFSQILPIVDNFDAAMAAADQGQDADNVIVGVRMIHEMLRKFLADNGVQPIKAEGEIFDPELHEAVAQQVTAGVEPNRVLEVVRRGYRMGDLVIRHAHVCVSAAPAGEPAPDADAERNESTKRDPDTE